MGGSSSTEQKVPNEQREVENEAASTGALPLLRNAFSKLADPQTNAIPTTSLQKCFCLDYRNPICEGTAMPDNYPELLSQLGPSVLDLFFVSEKGGVSWIEFVRGYVKCCGRMPVSMSLNTLLRVYNTMLTKTGLPSKLDFESSEADCKINGSLLPMDVLVFLWMCWTMLWDSRTVKSRKGERRLYLPNIEQLVWSAVVSCPDIASGIDVWDCKVSGLNVQLPVGKFVTWALPTVPNLPDCFKQFVNARLQCSVTSEENLGSSSSSPGDGSAEMCDNILLTCGRAWTLSLAIKDKAQEEILRACFPDNDRADENLLYRSTIHGRGINRVWSNVEGYVGPMLILISAASGNENNNSRKWIIGALMPQGFEDKDHFYGSSGSLFAVSPIFHVHPPSGRDKNFVYSHVHPKIRSYEPHPKPVGIAFGGTTGNERIYIEEDFAKVTIRHHAVDKTYQPGLLFPFQGYVPVEASISEVEVWGLGGRRAKETQTSYKKREEIFTGQRRKVDLKTFGNWEDSPEKMMMDMVSDPNAVRREDR